MSPRLLIAGLAASMLLISGSANAAKELYRWTDEKGVVHYSDTKPNGTEFERREVAADPAPIPAAAAEPPSPAAAPVAEKPKPKAQPSPECLLARSNLDTLNTAESVSMDTDGDGEPEVLQGDARQRAVVGAYELAQQLCSE